MMGDVKDASPKHIFKHLTVKDGNYAIQRPFVLVTKTGAVLNDAAQAFFDYVTSADANAVITAAGVVPAK